MFSEEKLKEVPENMEYIFRQLEENVLKDIVRRIKELDAISRTADYRLYVATQLRTYDHDLKKMIQKALKLSDAEMKYLFSKIIEQGYAQDESLYSDAGIPFVPFEENAQLKQFIDAVQEQTKNDINNLTGTIGFVLDQDGNISKKATEYFKNTMNLAVSEIALGTFDYNAVLKRITNEMSNSGLRTIDYESGHRDRLDVATRRAVVTGLRQIAQKISEDNAEQLHTEYFEVSAHATARPSHALWQGKIYTKEQLVSVCGLGDVTGLCGANCYHTYDPFIYGVSKRKYSDEDLSVMFQNTLKTYEFDGKKYTLYQATQRQRALERKMRTQDRKMQLLKVGGANQNDITEVKTRRTATYQDYKRFSKAVGLPEQMQRVFNSEKKPKISTSIETSKKEYKVLATSSYAELTNRQKKIDSKISESGTLYSFRKKDIKLSDLVSLTAKNGCEYAMFTKGNKRIAIRGTRYNTSDYITLCKLAKQGYRWSGHTHPFNDLVVPSSGDIKVLKLFKNNTSVVYNAFGEWNLFGED